MIIISILILFLFSVQLSAGPLQLMDSHNARGWSLAQSDLAYQGDLDSLMNNPAGLAESRDMSLSVFYLPWFEQMSFFSINAGYPIKHNSNYYGTIAGNVSVFSVEPFANYDNAGKQLSDIEVSDILLNIGYGLPVFDLFNFGINIKYANTQLDTVKSDPMALDISGLKEFTVPMFSKIKEKNNLRVALAFQNIGPSQTYISSHISTLYKIRPGACYTFYKLNFMQGLFLLDFNKTKNQNIKMNTGMEVGFIRIFRIRTGYKIVSDTAYRFTAGGGANYSAYGMNIEIDYAFIPLQDMSGKHALTLKLVYSGKERDVPKKKKLIAIEPPVKQQETVITNKKIEDSIAPKIRFINKMKKTKKRKYVLVGIVTDNRELREVKCTSAKALVIDKKIEKVNEKKTKFTYTLELKKGTNIIIITAEDSFKNISKKKYIIQRIR